MKSVNSGVVGVVGKVGLALLGGTTGGVEKVKGITCLPNLCGEDKVRVAEVVVVLVKVCEVVECRMVVGDGWVIARVLVDRICVASGLQV